MKVRGFTIVELLIVLALVSVIVSLSVGYFSSFMKARRLDNEVSALTLWMKEARLTAVGKGKRVSVEFKGAGYDYRVCLNQDDDCSCEPGSGDTELVKYSFRDPVEFDPAGSCGDDGVSFPDNCVCFAPDGFPKNCNGGFGAGSVCLTNGEKGKKISLSREGRIKIESY